MILEHHDILRNYVWANLFPLRLWQVIFHNYGSSSSMTLENWYFLMLQMYMQVEDFKEIDEEEKVEQEKWPIPLYCLWGDGDNTDCVKDWLQILWWDLNVHKLWY